jgi:hypothetical protein
VHAYVPVLATGFSGGGVAGVSTPGSGSSSLGATALAVVRVGVGAGVAWFTGAAVVPVLRCPGISTRTAPAKATAQTRTHTTASATVVPTRLVRCGDTH